MNEFIFKRIPEELKCQLYSDKDSVRSLEHGIAVIDNYNKLLSLLLCSFIGLETVLWTFVIATAMTELILKVLNSEQICDAYYKHLSNIFSLLYS